MIQGQTKTEANYRAINLDSSSSLKEFSTDRKKYYRKYILGESVDDKDTVAATTGRIVETMLLEPNEFDNRFYMSVCLSAPTGLMLAFVEALYKFTKEATDEQGNITRSFEEIAKDAYAESGFKIKFDAVINKFVGSDAEIFYNEMRTVKEKGLTVVTTEDVTNAEKIVEELRTNNVTAEVVNLVSSARYTVHNQLQIENYEVDGLMFKSMMDKVIVDHQKKTIQVYDLKCTWSVENFLEEYYLYRRAYIQAYLYYRAAHTLRDGELTGYDVLPPRFIVCDSTNYYNPLIYTLDYGNIEEAYSGFHHKNREYTGVKYLIEDLKWALENNVWNISRENHKQNGVVRLKIQDGAKENNN
jgi:hypothetical protein